MDRKYIDDHHVIARYLADRLTDDERRAFEAYYLEHPEIVQEMEAAARFKAGLLHLQRSGELDALMKAPERMPRRAWLTAAAALAALAVGVMVFVQHGPGTSPLLASNVAALRGTDGNALDISSTYRILRTRSSAVDANIALPAPPGAIALEILPEFDEASARYDVALLRVDGDDKTAVAQLDALGLNGDGFVSVFVDSSRLSSGAYELRLSSEAPTGAANVSVFSMRVRDAAP